MCCRCVWNLSGSGCWEGRRIACRNRTGSPTPEAVRLLSPAFLSSRRHGVWWYRAFHSSFKWRCLVLSNLMVSHMVSSITSLFDPRFSRCLVSLSQNSSLFSAAFFLLNVILQAGFSNVMRRWGTLRRRLRYGEVRCNVEWSKTICGG